MINIKYFSYKGVNTVLKNQRIFLPIGQGAFYTEKHGNINIVYDCGTSSNKTLGTKILKQRFSKDDVIDILFISHFHEDHISLIPELIKRVKRINNVILPFLHKNQKILLVNIFKVLFPKLIDLIKTPEKYFEESTTIIFINPSNNLIDDNEQVPVSLDLDNLPQQKVIHHESGVLINIRRILNWVFIPYNISYKKNNMNLRNEIIGAGLNYKKMTEDEKYPLRLLSNHKQQIKDIYKKSIRDLNLNSMFLYSGPLDQPKVMNISPKIRFQGYYINHGYSNEIGCIYCGDGNLNITKIENIFNKQWQFVGTIQIPHHGALSNFNNSFLKQRSFYCPISFGNNNIYGHPSSQVLGEILKHQSKPVLVSGDAKSIYLELW
jgi:hypothetical protein